MLAYLLLLVPLPPLGGFLLLALDPYRLDRRPVLAVSLAAGIAPLVLFLPLAIAYFTGAVGDMVAPVFTLNFGQYEVALAMQLDPLSAIGASTVTVVASCVMIYAADYMSGARVADLRRFFALMNLFQAGMLSMVLAADSIVFFLGWELMGLCSFFLISYNMTSPRAFAAGQKAFVMTRIADAALLAGLLLLFLEATSVRMDELIPAGLAAEESRAAIIAVLLLVGALGKSAQLPFQTWLPTAMAGPTPVSALLHSATMVAAGAVLLARFAPLIEATPGVAAATAIAGVATALFGALCAIAQTDVKRLLAYSSISQIGYMLLAVGMGAPGVAMAHFVIHAFFKSLLFMAAGVLSHAGGGSTEIEKLRGTAYVAPISFATYTVGAMALAGFPILSAGWWSKEAILGAAVEAGPFGQFLWLVALGGAALTGVYAYRPVLCALRKPRHDAPKGHESWLAVAPLIFLAIMSVLGGFLVEPIIHEMGGHAPHAGLGIEVMGALAAITGLIGSVAVTFIPSWSARIKRARRLRAGMQMDAIYYAFLVRPYRRIVRLLSGRDGRLGKHIGEGPEAQEGGMGDPVGTATVVFGLWLARVVTAPFMPDRFDTVIMRGAREARRAGLWTRRLQSGRLRDYALGLAMGLGVLVILGWGMTWG
ncbi:oxidoreductase [Roseibacterium beibuensis]|uniref:Proton-conducting transporter membrane subunit n=1 Tax=[Roseibacterium] beibuensis TaxID=1193142 RepID=A0ABP9L484_9RHOB|nr:proton-conducting transporter membrane subunit [Roseibacterium beibuensis]MCS6623770.1 oxidoreductase [Roseibacterium beibuensis]